MSQRKVLLKGAIERISKTEYVGTLVLGDFSNPERPQKK